MFMPESLGELRLVRGPSWAAFRREMQQKKGLILKQCYRRQSGQVITGEDRREGEAIRAPNRPIYWQQRSIAKRWLYRFQ